MSGMVAMVSGPRATALQPTVLTRNRNCLVDLRPTFDQEMPVWELGVGTFRVSTSQHSRPRPYPAARRRSRQAALGICHPLGGGLPF